MEAQEQQAQPRRRDVSSADADVVVAVEGSDQDDAALRCGVDEAARRGVGLRLLHVAPERLPAPLRQAVPDPVAAGRRCLAEAQAVVAGLDPGLGVRTTLSVGARVAELVRAARGSGLLVVGRESRHGVGRLVPGAVTAGVSAHAQVPVRVVPPDWSAPSGPAGPVVVGLAQSSGSDPMLEHALGEAERRGVPLVVLHAWHVPRLYEDLVEGEAHREWWTSTGHATAELALRRHRAARPGQEIEVRVEHRDPGAALVDASAHACLLVVQRPATVGLVDGHLGRVSRAVMASAGCPVDVVPPDLAAQSAAVVA